MSVTSSIQLRRGTGTSTPSELLPGELAINTDSGHLYYGSTGADNEVSSSIGATNLFATTKIVLGADLNQGTTHTGSITSQGLSFLSSVDGNLNLQFNAGTPTLANSASLISSENGIVVIIDNDDQHTDRVFSVGHNNSLPDLGNYAPLMEISESGQTMFYGGVTASDGITGSFTGSLSGTSTAAVVSGRTQTVYTNHGNVTDTTCFIPFVNNGSDAYQELKIEAGLTYNATSNILATSTFQGALNGNATTATTADCTNNQRIQSISEDADFYLTFVARDEEDGLCMPEFTNRFLRYNPDRRILTIDGAIKSKGSDVTIESGSISMSRDLLITGSISASGAGVSTFTATTGSFEHIITHSGSIEFVHPETGATLGKISHGANGFSLASTANLAGGGDDNHMNLNNLVAKGDVRGATMNAVTNFTSSGYSTFRLGVQNRTLEMNHYLSAIPGSPVVYRNNTQSQPLPSGSSTITGTPQSKTSRPYYHFTDVVDLQQQKHTYLDAGDIRNMYVALNPLISEPALRAGQFGRTWKPQDDGDLYCSWYCPPGMSLQGAAVIASNKRLPFDVRPKSLTGTTLGTAQEPECHITGSAFVVDHKVGTNL